MHPLHNFFFHAHGLFHLRTRRENFFFFFFFFLTGRGDDLGRKIFQTRSYEPYPIFVSISISHYAIRIDIRNKASTASERNQKDKKRRNHSKSAIKGNGFYMTTNQRPVVPLAALFALHRLHSKRIQAFD